MLDGQITIAEDLPQKTRTDCFTRMHRTTAVFRFQLRLYLGGEGSTSGPIVGKVMADLILDGRTKYDLAFMAADRFHDLPGYQQRADIKRECYEMYASYYGQVEKPNAPAAKP